MSENQVAESQEVSTVAIQDFKFRFKKDKLGNQRPNIEIKGFVPSVEGILEIIDKGGKGLELLQDALYDVVRGAIAEDVAENEAFSQETYETAIQSINGVDLHKYSWDAIANQPREDRRANSIPKELWEAFSADYIEVMPEVTGKSVEAVTNATIVYNKKFSLVKTDKSVLNKLKEQLAIYMTNSKKADEFADILETLIKKADTYLASDDVEMLKANL